jgi:hypothetical protein
MAGPPSRSTIAHRALGLHLLFSSEGIAIHPIARRPIQVTWPEIDFVSPTPAPEQVDGLWHFPHLLPERGWNMLRDQEWFCLDVVVGDRQAVKRRSRWYALGMKPVWMADDRPHPAQGTFPLDIRVRRLDASPTDLLALIARHSRFDLLCHV